MKRLSAFNLVRRIPHCRILFIFVLALAVFMLSACSSLNANSNQPNPSESTKAPANLEFTLPPSDTTVPLTIGPTVFPYDTAIVGTQTPVPADSSPTPCLTAGSTNADNTPQMTDNITTAPTPAPSPSPVITAVPTAAQTSAPDDTWQTEAVFLGVEGYGHINASAVSAPGARVYRFRVNEQERLFSIKHEDGFPIQNRLMENYRYRLWLTGTEVTRVELLTSQTAFTPSVSGTPGQRTLLNFLKTAFMPMGSALYVYGGGWDWQDEGSSVQSTTIGVCGSWVDFYRSNNAGYLYKDSAHPEQSTYPFGGWNEYYYAGLDCSGYLGWVLYNTLEMRSGHSGYVYKSRQLAKTLAQYYHYGVHSSAMFELGEGQLRPGDIISMPDHVYICLGRCSDGSILILHSTVSQSVTGARGGGVQLSVLSPNNSTNCEAYRLAVQYTRSYFPDWISRYPVNVKSFSTYLGFNRNGTTGVFRWTIGSGGLQDPEGVREMSAAQILQLIFGH